MLKSSPFKGLLPDNTSIEPEKIVLFGFWFFGLVSQCGGILSYLALDSQQGRNVMVITLKRIIFFSISGQKVCQQFGLFWLENPICIHNMKLS